MEHAQEAITLDAETKVAEAPEDHRRELRLWLRLLTCTTLVEGEIRRRLRAQFGMTLPRFDFLAQLERAHGGMPLGEVSRRMMVSNGNVTLLAERLVAEGLVRRAAALSDRRRALVELTPAGRRRFARAAAAHAEWIGELLGGLAPDETATLMTLLCRAKAAAREKLQSDRSGRRR